MNKYICDYCGKEFFKYPSQLKGYIKHYCSNECRYKANKQTNKIYYENDYAYILLTKDNITKKVLFDIDDIEKIQMYKWHLHLRKSDMRYDACTNTSGSHKTRRYVNMPRYLLDYQGDLTIDHINRNTLDNRKQNLEIKTNQQNSMNIHTHKNSTTGISGVNERDGKWIARIGFKNKRIFRKKGYFRRLDQKSS